MGKAHRRERRKEYDVFGIEEKGYENYKTKTNNLIGFNNYE